MTEQKKTRSLKYLGIELLQKNATKSSVPKVGLFRGIKVRSNKIKGETKILKLILTGFEGKENDLTGYNADMYNVLSLKMMHGDTKELIVFKATEADQTVAMEMLNTALDEFKEEKRMVDNDSEIVDIKTFKDVPAEFRDGTTQSKTTNVGTAHKTSSYGGIYNHGSYNSEEWKKKEEERKKEKERQEKLRWTPTLIKRESDLPTLKVLNAMRKKVNAIAKGEYKVELEDPDKSEKEGSKTEAKTATAPNLCKGCIREVDDALGGPDPEDEICLRCENGDMYDDGYSGCGMGGAYPMGGGGFPIA